MSINANEFFCKFFTFIDILRFKMIVYKHIEILNIISINKKKEENLLWKKGFLQNYLLVYYLAL